MAPMSILVVSLPQAVTKQLPLEAAELRQRALR
jgi:hypothetical protein